ncbi:site-specific integrase [Streptomyces sp. NPDC127117]|uniref:site-specific integrase n=1 Tax=Streptomyces sp. NPDC127117 TaxID=3345368 RepID=UPI00363C61A3
MNHAGGCIGAGVVNRLLKKACRQIEGDDHRFHGIHFTAHGFRRLFATDLVNSAVPIHIDAALLGHLNVQTTRGSMAVFEEDVVRHYQQFLANRRQPPSESEYRDPTAHEWHAFEGHFGTREAQLGLCGRPYGSPCNHEHACTRCPVLQVNPEMISRLEEIEQDLLDRRERAESEGWKGEIEGIGLTLQLLRQKHADATRFARLTGRVTLGMPAVRPATSHSSRWLVGSAGAWLTTCRLV